MPGLGVMCDRCDEVAPPVRGNQIGNGTIQRAVARQNGWLCDETGDFCPDCWDAPWWHNLRSP